jgi:hypothetical protein
MAFKKLTRGDAVYFVSIANIAFVTPKDGATQINFCTQGGEGHFGTLIVSETPEQILGDELA